MKNLNLGLREGIINSKRCTNGNQGQIGTNRDMSPSDSTLGPSRRLDTWKEIGAFFDRDERTVKRWETTRGLPVHRVPGTGRANVYANTDELAEWLHGAKVTAEQDSDPHSGTLNEGAGDSEDETSTEKSAQSGAQAGAD